MPRPKQRVPFWILAARLLYAGVLVALTVTALLKRYDFAISSDYFQSTGLLLANLLAAVLLAAIGLLVIAAPYRWASGVLVGSVSSQLVARFDANGGRAKNRGIALVVVAVIVSTLMTYFWSEAALLHGLSNPSDYRGEFTVVERSGGGKGCGHLAVSDEASAVWNFCLWQLPAKSDRLAISGSRSWYGIQADHIEPLEGPK